jgi:threonine/homoserine/homoserine lactone efflux protein
VGKLLAETLPLALAAAISPVLFLLQLTTLTGPRPVARGSMLALGAALPLAAVSVFAVSVGSSSRSLHSDSALKASHDVAFGCLLLALAAWTLVRHPAPKPKRPPKEPSLRRAFLFGLAGMATNVSTFALYIPALKLIAAADVGAASQALVGAIVFVFALSFVLVPLVLTATVPASQRALSATGTWMTTHRRALNVVLLVAFGAWLVLKGARAL